MDKLYDKLVSYRDQGYYPMHMPGHKRNANLMQMVNPYEIDITEINGFDNLHQPEDILKQLSVRLSRLYGAGKSFPLVNGSTAGLLAAISAATNRRDEILVARNSHKSVYHAIELRDLKPVYLYPPKMIEFSLFGGYLAQNIEELLIKHHNIKVVVITSPTYEGMVSDISAIAEVVHRHNALLIVDEAHGAHFGLYEGFPRSSVTQGADLVIQSLHKTLPAFTQTAVIHSNRKDMDAKLQHYLAIYESSSPSYVLMAGIDRCLSLLEERGEKLFVQYYSLLNEFYCNMKMLKNLKLVDRNLVGRYGINDCDPSKITISTQATNLSGHQLQELLRERFKIEFEMAAPEYVLGMTSIADTKEGFDRMGEALLVIDNELEHAKLNLETSSKAINSEDIMILEKIMNPEQVYLPGDAMEEKTEQVKLIHSQGRVSATFISLFPPGSPILVPGERIKAALIDYLQEVKEEKITITGLVGEFADEIEVIDSSIND